MAAYNRLGARVTVDLEIDLFGRLRQAFPESVGLVVQAYLKRTPDDIERLATTKASNPKVFHSEATPNSTHFLI